MKDLQTYTENFLEHCRNQKRLNEKTLKSYRIDLKQFRTETAAGSVFEITPDTLENFLAILHRKYKPKTVKRKIAVVKAFFHYLEYKDIIDRSPFYKIHVKFREPAILPRTIPIHTVEHFLSVIYLHHAEAKTDFQRKRTLRDIAVIELLFATGMRISELCSLNTADVNLRDRSILIYGKGSKERKIQIGSDDVVRVLEKYKAVFLPEMQSSGNFFTSLSGKPLSDQSVRRMIRKYTSLADIDLHITPHMFRHTFATSLLEADVDIRYIQEMLGHSSINITEIYTHVAMSKQRDILATKHPRKTFTLEI